MAVVKLSSNRQAWFYTNSIVMPTSRKGSQGGYLFSLPTSPCNTPDEGVATALICGPVATTIRKRLPLPFKRDGGVSAYG